MRTLLFIIAFALTGCPKQAAVPTPVIETPEEGEARRIETQLAELYERFIATCKQRAIIGQEEWFLNCTESLGYAVEGYPSNSCTGWTWLSHGVLTPDIWDARMVEIDKARTGLTQLWLILPAKTRSDAAMRDRGVNPWVIDPYFNWYCPPPPSSP